MSRIFLCVFLTGLLTSELPAFSVASTASLLISQPDSIPKKKHKQYTAWIDVARTDSISGKSIRLGRYKGRLKGITDSSLILETLRPHPEWEKAGAYYEVPYSDIDLIAFRKTFAPLLGVGIGFLGGTVAGAIAGVSSAGDAGGGQQELHRDLSGILGAILGATAGVAIGLAVSLKKKKYHVGRDKTIFSGLNMAFRQYLQ